MARGRKTTLLDSLDASVRERIDAAIASHRNEPIASIYRRFGLAQEDVSERSFHDYAKRLRRKLKSEGKAAGQDIAHADDVNLAGLTEDQLFDRMLRRILVRGLERIDAGDTKAYEDARYLSEALRFQRLKIDEAVDDRAAELHELKLTELRKSMKEAVDARTGSGEQMGREEVYDLIDSIMRGEAA
jgi:hypothetical protein